MNDIARGNAVTTVHRHLKRWAKKFKREHLKPLSWVGYRTWYDEDDRLQTAIYVRLEDHDGPLPDYYVGYRVLPASEYPHDLSRKHR